MARPGGRTLVIGVAALAIGLVSAKAVRMPGENSPAPTDDYAAVAAAAPSTTGETRWVEDRRWDLPVTYNDRVGFWIEFLQGRNADHTRKWLERLGRYGPMIRAELRQRGMPEDLIYLAMIESGLSPNAYSHAAAAGMWQFISATGQRYGLEVNGYVDERRDPVKATSAALDYLQELHDRFGSWYLAAASYNTGENRVARVLDRYADGARGDEDLFWKIDDHLPQETRDYVPLMLAAGYIGKDPARYGFDDIEYQEPLEFDEVVVPGATRLTTVAKAAEVDASRVSDLNPQLVRDMAPPGGRYTVRIPRGQSLAFAQNFERVYAEAHAEPAVRLASYTIGRGETLSHVAARFHTTVSALEAANDGLNPRALQVGQEIRVPSTGDAPARRPAWTTYRVRRGDSLWTIAHRHGVSVGELRQWNGISGRSRILPGQKLRIGA